MAKHVALAERTAAEIGCRSLYIEIGNLIAFCIVYDASCLAALVVIGNVVRLVSQALVVGGIHLLEDIFAMFIKTNRVFHEDDNLRR